MTEQQMNTPLITVIVPVYKVEDTLDRCLESIVNQTYRNLEIILVDDGSPDNCPAMCDAWAGKDSRISVIHQQNGGLSAARNSGLDRCSGEYIAFVDSDDYIEPAFIERMVHEALRTDADLAICGIIRESTSDGTVVQRPETPSERVETLDRDAIIARFTASSPNNLYVVAWNKLYRRSLWKDVQYPVGRLNEDLFVIHRLYDQCSTVVVLPEAMYHYCLSADSIMRSAYTIRRLDCVDAFCDRLTYLHGKASGAVLNDTVMRALSELIQGYRALDFSQPSVASAYRALAGHLSAACSATADALSGSTRCHVWWFMHARPVYSAFRGFAGTVRKLLRR